MHCKSYRLFAAEDAYCATGYNWLHRAMDIPIISKSKYRLADAKSSLKAADQTMGELIRLVGVTKVRSEADLSVFQSLVRAIAYQMISTKAAAAIHGRLLDRCDADLQPQRILEIGEQALREIGYSRAKVASLLDLSEKCVSGVVPDDDALSALSDKELVRCLTQVRGVGVWSVEMLMIFNLRRPDVFPATDLGVRRGHMLAYGLDEMLDAKALLALSDIWRPYRSVAAWYLWRANDCVDWTEIPACSSRKNKTSAKVVKTRAKRSVNKKK